MKVTNTSVLDSVLVVWRRDGMGPSALVLSAGSGQFLDGDVEILGTYKLVQVTKLVDDPTVCEVEE